jgi:hypothetical protein
MRSGSITGNEASMGGGVGVDTAAAFTMKGGTITNNTAVGEGGGIYAYFSGSTVTIEGGSITNNSASNRGGGVAIDTSAGFSITRGSITGNTAAYGRNLSIATDSLLNNISWNSCTIGDVITGGIAYSDRPLKGWNTQADWSGAYSTTLTAAANNPVWSGNGSTFPIAITKLSELAAIGDDINTLSCEYALANDITLGSTWIAMGDATYPFTGTLDGRGHTITVPSGGTTITPQVLGSINDSAGLFGSINGSSALITDLTLAGGAFTAVVNAGNGLVMGGIVGWMSAGTILNCAVRISIIQNSLNAASGEIGGIAGSNASAGIIQNCYSSGAIDVTLPSVSEIVYVGGIAGDNTGTITNCYSTGNISGSSYETSAGGIAGHHTSTVPIRYCYATGNVTGDSPGSNAGYYGGIGGQVTAVIENCVALNGSIFTTDSIINRGRIYFTASTPSCNYNYGRYDMNPGPWTYYNSINGRDGGDVSMGTSPTEANSQAWWESTTIGPVWTISSEGSGNDATPWEWDSDRTLPKLYWE